MIRIEGLCYHAGDFSADNIDLSVSAGEYFVLLGPNGSGKTLMLKCLAGLIRADAGRIFIDGADVTDIEPRLRGIGYVPQDYGLFPHMNIARNITFALRMQGKTHSAALARLSPLIEMLDLSRLLDRSPVGLSGGERQKVALARALALRPKLLLLDEPMSALDDPTRRGVSTELARVQRELSVPTIHVCHSLEESLTVSDRAGVMIDGRLIQVGTMDELMHRPADATVARLLHAENILTGEAVPDGSGGSTIDLAGRPLSVPVRCEGRVRFVVRAEHLRVSDDGPNRVPAVLTRMTNLGPYSRLEFDAGVPIVVYSGPGGPGGRLRIGESYCIEFPPDAIHVMGMATGVEAADGR